MKHPQRIATATLLLLLATTFGCGSRDPFQYAPVSGVVTLDGDPLEGARVSLEPQAAESTLNAGFGSYATTDQKGRFTLTTLHGKSGAVPGPHTVRISTLVNRPGADGVDLVRAEEVPDRYFQAGALTFIVPPEGTNQANFTLTTEPPGEEEEE